MPSWKMSVANLEVEPISRPPTSIQCITTTMNPISTGACPRVDRGIHDDVVEMLSDRPRVVGDDDVAIVQVLWTVEREAIENSRAHHVRHETPASRRCIG